MSKKSFLEEQNYALRHSGRNLIVSASAGSGKTTVLIAKLAELLANGADITRMVVMTFTRMASEEMKERLADRVAVLMREEPEKRASLAKNLANMPFANITTIDGFCADLFKRWFNELGEDSQYSIIESDDERRAMFEEAADAVINRRYASEDESFKDLCERFSERRTAGGLKKAVWDICAFWDVQPDREACVKRAEEEIAKPIDERRTTAFVLGGIRRRAAEFYDLLKNAEMRLRSLGETVLLDNVTEHKDAHLRIKDAARLEELYGQLSRIGAFSRRSSKKAKTPEGEAVRAEVAEILTASKKFVEDLKARFSDYERDMREELASNACAKLLFETAAETAEEYDKLKRGENKLDFADLEHFALKILADPERRREIREGIDYIFLDEYQDTNYLQEEIIKGISKDDNVFMVGDVKQCIYRFRAAEPQIFIDKYRNYSEKRGGDSVAFNKNWRSSTGILDFVNGVMSEIMTVPFGGVDYREEAELAPAIENYPRISDAPDAVFVRKAKTARAKTEYVSSEGYDLENAVAKLCKKADEEAEYIAGVIADTVGKQSIFDAKRGETRTVTYGDIAVLLRKNRDCDSVAATLRSHGIPVYQCAEGADFYAEDKNCLLDYLKLIDNSRNDLPLISVLLSPLGNFRDEELYEIRKTDRQKPFWYTFFNYNGSLKLENKIEEFKKKLYKHRLYAASSDVFDLLVKVVADFSFDAYVMGSPSGSERIERHNMFLMSLKGKEYSATVKDFLKYAEKVSFSVQPPASASSAVNVMSVHKSKGLEFPIVFLAHTSYRSASRRPDVALDREFGMAVRFFDGRDRSKRETFSTLAFADKKERAEKEDEMRLLYVAMTRAQNRLIITGNESSAGCVFADDLKTFGQFLAFAAERNDKIKKCVREFSLPEQNSETTETESLGEIPNVDFSPLLAEYPYAAATETRAKYAVSALSEYDGEEVSPAKVMFDVAEDRIRTGIVCHAVMERVDFERRDLSAVEEAADSLVADGTITREEREKIDVKMLAEVLKLDIFKVAARSRTEREKSFMLYLPLSEIDKTSKVSDCVLVQGVIDLLITGEENIIVDYKYTSASKETVKNRYRTQLDLYAEAFEKITAKKVSKKVLVLLRTAEIIEF